MGRGQALRLGSRRAAYNARMASVMRELDGARFERDGYLVVPGLAGAAEVGALRAAALSALEPLTGPVEFEADVGYPGAPADRSAPGGDTPRRLLHAYGRDEVFRAWQTDARLGARLEALLGGARPMLSQCHHNCVMTKFPGYSSETLWHQDIRYWSFDRSELISVWLALGPETAENGALSVIPGSHRLELSRGRLDRHLFLRRDLEENQRLIEGARLVTLEAGDTLFFHCRLFHAAGANHADIVKLSLVSTYHAADNHPIPGTRSAQYPPVPVDA